MRFVVFMVSLLLLAGSAVVGFADCDLRSRGFAGFGYRDLTDADRESAGHPDLEGIAVTVIVPGSPAERAGMQTGDIVTGLDGSPIGGASDLISALRLYYVGDSVVVSAMRRGEEMDLPVVFAANRETSDEIEVEYTCFESSGTLLRAVVTSPLGSSGKQLPGLLIVSALGSPRMSGLPYYNMGRDLAHAFSRNGFRVIRFELRGAGDSEGEDYRTRDFMTEVDDNLAALDYLGERGDIDREHVFVMGHSTGGMIAAVVASRRDLSGLIVSCTVGRTFYERMLETLRFQGKMGGDAPETLDRILKDYLDLTVGIARGDSLSAIVARNPNVAAYVNAAGRIMDDRNIDYWRQQLNLNLSETYSEIDEPVLMIYAASDFLTQLACHEHIRDVLVTSGNDNVTLEVIQGVDHAYSHANDKEDSYRNYQTRDFRGSPEPIERIVRWLTEIGPDQ
jgi:alpha-beta hydrolase superfamily lysophospholipase